MAVNKVVYGGKTVMDLTTDNVTADKMLSGTTAHDKSGEKITGTIETFDGSYECSGESTGGGSTVEAWTGTVNATGDTTLHTAGKYCEEDILVKVPEAGGGGGGGSSVETCTVTYYSDQGIASWLSYTAYVNGQYVPVLSPYAPASDYIGDYIMNDVVKGSAITIMAGYDLPLICEGAELIAVESTTGCYVVKPIASVATIQLDYT